MKLGDIMGIDKEYIRSALEEGVSGEGIKNSIEDMLDKSDEIGHTPEQIRDVIDTISSMKQSPNVVDNSYNSALVRENSAKIKSAITEGLTPNEVSHTLENNLEKQDDNRKFKFIINLISKMKKKEKSLSKKEQMEKGFQKVKVNN